MRRMDRIDFSYALRRMDTAETQGVVSWKGPSAMQADRKIHTWPSVHGHARHTALLQHNVLRKESQGYATHAGVKHGRLETVVHRHTMPLHHLLQDLVHAAASCIPLDELPAVAERASSSPSMDRHSEAGGRIESRPTSRELIQTPVHGRTRL